jgi:hypothetical protein
VRGSAQLLKGYMSTTLSQLEAVPATVEAHAAQIASLNVRLAQHEATVADISAKWAALTAAFAPTHTPVTRPLAAIPVK